MEWAAFDRVWGPILPHERIDIGVAQLSYLLVNLLSKPKRGLELEDFMPAWWTAAKRRAERAKRSDQQVADAFGEMLRAALANDQHTRR